jgi:dipeptidyl aminopeptidase/acylaminoacyl peptidase
LKPKVLAGLLADDYQIGNMKLCHEQTHKQESQYLHSLMFKGHTITQEAQDKIWEEKSAVFHADKIKGALLLLQGLDDTVVPPNQAEDMAKIMNENGADVKTIFFEGEGHGFRKADSKKRVVEEEEAWWRRLLVTQ